MKIHIVLLSVLTLYSCSGTRPVNIGFNDGRFLQCPDKPNCVSSFAAQSDSEHYIKPIDGNFNWDKAYSAIQFIIEAEGGEIISKSEKYIYAEFTSTIFRFVDDVEFYFDEQAKVVHMRSASRIGHSDLGVNRKRMEKIRFRFIQNEY